MSSITVAAQHREDQQYQAYTAAASSNTSAAGSRTVSHTSADTATSVTPMIGNPAWMPSCCAVSPPSSGATAKLNACALPTSPNADPCLPSGALAPISAFTIGIIAPLNTPTAAIKKSSGSSEFAAP